MTLRAYPPTQTIDFLTCPRLWGLKKTWQEPESQWTPNRLLGTAVGAGLSAYYRGRRGGPELRPRDALVEALTDGYVEQDVWTAESLITLALRATTTVLDNDPLVGHTILLVDEDCGDGARPDVVSRGPEGLCVTDFKCRLKLDKKYEDDAVADWETNHQLWDYAWRAGQKFEEPVVWTQALMVVLTPKVRIVTAQVRVTPERLALWEKGAMWAWEQMATMGELAQTAPSTLPGNWTRCRTRYGLCPFYGHDHQGQALETFYQRKERRVDHGE